MNSDNTEMIAGKKMLLQVQNNKVVSVDWLGKNKDDIEHFVSTNGALLIRGLKTISVEEYGGVLESVFGEELATYNNRSTPRTELKSGINTATEYHASERIPQHNEASY